MTHHRLAAALCLLLLGVLPVTSHAQSAWNSLSLTWTAPGDDSLTGTATQYDLRYSTATITAANFASATRVTGMAAPGASGATETVTVTGLSPATTYYFAIKTADDAGNWSLISNVPSKATSAAPDTLRPARGQRRGQRRDRHERHARLDRGRRRQPHRHRHLVPDPLLDLGHHRRELRERHRRHRRPTPAAPGTAQGVVVRGLSRQVTYYFALRTVDEAGNVSALSNVPTATTTDTLAPAAIRNLATLFVWVSLHIDLATPLREVLP